MVNNVVLINVLKLSNTHLYLCKYILHALIVCIMQLYFTVHPKTDVSPLLLFVKCDYTRYNIIIVQI